MRYLVGLLFSIRVLWAGGDGRFYILLSVAMHTGKVVPFYHSLGGDVVTLEEPLSLSLTM